MVWLFDMMIGIGRLIQVLKPAVTSLTDISSQLTSQQSYSLIKTHPMHCYMNNQCPSASIRDHHLEEGYQVRLLEAPDSMSLLLPPLELEAAMFDLLPLPVRLLLQPFGLL